MRERVKAIKKYYTDLEYTDLEKENALTKVANLCNDIERDVDIDFSIRFSQAKSIIEEKLSLFQSVCKHVDIITTIVKYLDYFNIKAMVERLPEHNKAFANYHPLILNIIYTLFNVCTEPEVQLFLENVIIKNSGLELPSLSKLKDQLSCQTNEVIILQDTDLYAFISHLRIIEKSYSLNKIWVQAPIKEEFLYFIEKYEYLVSRIRVFRSKQELVTSNAPDKINIVSIWTENIVVAKNLARTLNYDVLFINTHMDLCGGTVLLPYDKLSLPNSLDCLKLEKDEDRIPCSLKSLIDKSIHKYDLLYDGMWQKPVNNSYWLSGNILRAHATSDDIKRCIDSTKKALKTWSIRPIDSRMEVLYHLMYTFQRKGFLKLAKMILKSLKLSYYYENLLLHSHDEKLEITTIRKPRGIIVLKERSAGELFVNIIQALAAGNCVIVIADSDKPICQMEYYEIMLTSKIPPGVINLLSCEKIENILNVSVYENYKKIFKTERGMACTSFALHKDIILSLK